MAALLFRQLHGLNTLHTFLQCIRTIHFGSVKCSWAWPGSWDLHCCLLCAYTASAEPPPHCRRQSSCSAFPGSPAFIPLTPQRWANRTARPNTDFPQQPEKSQLKASRCRQQPWYCFIQHKLSSCWWERGSLPPPPTASLRDCQLQGSQEPMLVPQCSHPCGGRAPLALPWQPLPLKRVPRHRQGWHHAGCTAARELAGRGEKVKREQPWRPGRRNGLGQKGRAPMGELCEAACSSQGQAP